MRLCSRLDWTSIVELFPTSKHAIFSLKDTTIAEMKNMVHLLEKTADGHRTFYNTVRLYDSAKFKFMMYKQIFATLATLSFDDDIRLAAEQAFDELQKYETDHLIRNPHILHAFQNYAQHGIDDQNKTSSTRSFLEKMINQLEHEGASLSKKSLHHVYKLSEKIHHTEKLFMSNLMHAHKSLSLSHEELQGVPTAFLVGHKQSDGMYKIPLNYDSFFAILENCEVLQTRKKFFFAWNNRVHPANYVLLKKLLGLRNEYARAVGYKNFAEYECALQMIGSVQSAHSFIQSMIEQTQDLVKKEFDILVSELPASVMLTPEGKLQPWDESFVKNSYRKKHFDLDHFNIAEYFPISHVMYQLKKQFGEFFGLGFEVIDPVGLWHNDLICLRVRRLQGNEIMGYIVFDLYARDGKADCSHQMSVIPAIQDDCNLMCSGMAVVATNFVKNNAVDETLLQLHDVKTLLHEFGHALHALFGSTTFVDFSGTQVAKDFVEVPSQLFELWIDNPSMLALFSQHYVTKQPLPADIVAKIMKAEKFGKASLLQRECLLSLIALEFGMLDDNQDPHALVQKLYSSVRQEVQSCPDDYFETTFDHLISYGSHYYGYVWSKVLAAGLFEYVMKHGITSVHAGQALYEKLLSHGGSKDPYILVEMLLGSTISKKALLDSLSTK